MRDNPKKTRFIHNNIDQIEITKFEKLANQWWDMEGAFKALHDINPLRLNYIDEHVGLAGKKVLDIGCGGGIFSESMALRGAEVTGIDMGYESLLIARLHAIKNTVDVNYSAISSEKLAEEVPESFDVVTCLEMLEHVQDPSSIVTACYKLLKPGGTIFFSTINRNIKSWLFAIVGAEYIFKILPKGTHEHSKFIKPHELCQWMRNTNLTIHDIIGMIFNPLTGLYKLKKNSITINYLIYGSKSKF